METTDYVGYELSMKLKACGFDEPCRHYYDIEDAPDGCYWEGGSLHKKNHNEDIPKFSAPTLWHAQKWLREKKGIVVTVGFEPVDDSDMVYTYSIKHYNPDGGKNVCDCWDTYRSLNGCGSTYSGGWDTYEEALSAGIAGAIKLINKREK